MSEWKPISEYDAMKKKPTLCAFLFKATEPKRIGGGFLKETIQLQRVFGSRECTMFFEIKEPPK